MMVGFTLMDDLPDFIWDRIVYFLDFKTSYCSLCFVSKKFARLLNADPHMDLDHKRVLHSSQLNLVVDFVENVVVSYDVSHIVKLNITNSSLMKWATHPLFIIDVFKSLRELSIDDVPLDLPSVDNKQTWNQKFWKFVDVNVIHCFKPAKKLESSFSFPNSLISLSISNCNLISFPEYMPPFLEVLICSDNQLSILPDFLPHSIHTIQVSNNKLSALPEYLPIALTELDCSENYLEHVPNFPSLIKLFCQDNYIIKFPLLPNSLTVLDCSSNEIRAIEQLPTMLRSFHCESNHIESISYFPLFLEEIFCFDNELDKLPPLPVSLTYLSCNNNNLTELPYLPDSLLHLDCSYNNLEILPEVPLSLENIIISNNDIPDTDTSVFQKIMKSKSIRKYFKIRGISSDKSNDSSVLL